MKRILTFTALFLLIVSCSNALDKVYSEDNLKNDMESLQKDGVSEEDRITIAGRIMGSMMTGNSIKGKTYGEILKDAKAYQFKQDSMELENKRKEDELAAKVQKEKQERIEKMRDAVTVSIFDKRVAPKNYDQGRYSAHNVFSYAIENKKEQPITAIKFAFDVNNALGDPIGKGFQVAVTNHTIPANGKINDEAWYEINEFTNEDMQMAAEDYDKLKINIEVIKVVFADGTILE